MWWWWSILREQSIHWGSDKMKYTILAATDLSEARKERINALANLKTEEEEILTFDVSDEALEIAGTVSDKTNFTWGVCTVNQTGCPS
jgi:hypothetical protein